MSSCSNQIILWIDNKWIWYIVKFLMGIMPGFVCIYFRAQSWNRTDKVSFLLEDQKCFPFPPQETLGGPTVRIRMASCTKGSSWAKRCTVRSTELPSALIKVVDRVGNLSSFHMEEMETYTENAFPQGYICSESQGPALSPSLVWLWKESF